MWLLLKLRVCICRKGQTGSLPQGSSENSLGFQNKSPNANLYKDAKSLYTVETFSIRGSHLQISSRLLTKFKYVSNVASRFDYSLQPSRTWNLFSAGYICHLLMIFSWCFIKECSKQYPNFPFFIFRFHFKNFCLSIGPNPLTVVMVTAKK